MIAEALHGCIKCGRDLPASQFYISRGKRNGLHSYCRECCRKFSSIAVRAKKYGLSADEVEVILQVPCCQACSRELDSDRSAKFDHHHGSGKFRGVLCNRCNTCLHALDNPDLMGRLVSYRDRHAEAHAWR